MQEKIIILDFGSQTTQLIGRRVRELNTYCEIVPYNKFPKDDPSVIGVILYSSESVGGDDSAGLKAVDSRIGEEYFYLGSIAGGQRGTVRLTVGHDGETQGKESGWGTPGEGDFSH